MHIERKNNIEWTTAMAHSTSVSQSQTGLSSAASGNFWQQTRLSVEKSIYAVQAYVSDVNAGSSNPVSAMLSHLLTFQTMSGSQLVAKRSTPSAGSIYPIEIMGIMHDGNVNIPFRICPLSGQIQELSAEYHALIDECLGGRSFGDGKLRLAICARPGKSIRKYGDRGYWYALLDAGHVLAGLAILCQTAGMDAKVSLCDLSGNYGDAGGFRLLDPVAIVELETTTQRISEISSRLDQVTPHHWLADEVEQALWDTTKERILSDEQNTRTNLVSAAPEASTTFNIQCCNALENRSFAQICDLFAKRVSAKSFDGASISHSSFAHLADVVDRGFIGRLVSNLSPDLTASLLLNEDLYADLGERGLATASSNELELCCMGQELGRAAGAMIVLHASKPDQNVQYRQLSISSAMLAQSYYLEAAARSIGITCIGGYDDTLVKKALSLNADREVVNLLLVGAPDASLKVKHDKYRIAYSHGRFST